MEESRVTFSVPTCSNTAADIVKNSTIIEEGPRICPLCNSIVKIFYVNYSSKILMCENIECEYPFGEDFTIYESDDDGYFLSEIDMSSIKSKRSRNSRQTSELSTNQSQGTSSELSTSEWSEISRLPDHSYDSDESVSSKIFTRKSTRQRMEKQTKKQENEENIKQNVEKIKELNKVLYENEEDFNTIRNEKWIKNLNSLQSSSGMRLLKDQELQKLKKTSQNMDIGELKIDIESRKDSISSIKIEIGKSETKNVADK